MRARLRRWAPALVVALGLAQMVGATLDLPIVRGLAAATAASPAPKVFTTLDGFEAFSTRFFITYVDVDGRRRSLALTPARYARIAGPYNRRNAYGAVVAGGPVLSRRPLTRPMVEAVSRYALCGDAPLLRELGVDPARVASPVTLRYEPRAGAAPPPEIPLALTVECPR
ncbi:MAG TPA: hypothetical protein RMH99_28380 [Sandaracinaceae bacterium LLY-WYZ-13_1]|nr:hypothetical protein [Sandaracinaceae bacterium LLY-WYZ-13_1]